MGLFNEWDITLNDIVEEWDTSPENNHLFRDEGWDLSSLQGLRVGDLNGETLRDAIRLGLPKNFRRRFYDITIDPFSWPTSSIDIRIYVMNPSGICNAFCIYLYIKDEYREIGRDIFINLYNMEMSPYGICCDNINS